MGIVVRGVKNAFRNAIRSIGIISILAISIGLSLIMLVSYKAVQSKISNIKNSIGNTVAVSPAGVRGFEGGGDLLTESDIKKVSSLAHVSKVTETLSDRLTEDQNTNLASGIEPGSFGKRRQNQEMRQYRVNDDGPVNSSRLQMPTNFKMPVTVTGVNDLSNLPSLNISSLNITSGSQFDASKDQNVALVGKTLAEKNNLKIGSTFKAYDKNVTVAGIFDSGNQFSNNMVLMPIKALQRLSSQSNQISNIVVQVDSIDNLDSVTSSLKTTLGDKADVVSSQDTEKAAIEPLENIRAISMYSLIGALVAGSVIVFFSMLMIVRERRREIGVLKAIGASNILISGQFIVEAMILTIAGSIIGAILGFFLSNPVVKALAEQSSSGPAGGQIVRGGGGFIRTIGMPGIQNSLRDIQTTVGYDIIIYGLLAAILIAIIGSLIPSYFIAKIRPAEVMRND